MNPCNIPRFQLGEDLIFDVRPLNDMGVSVRIINPQRGSSVSILSKMYSILSGLVVLMVTGGGCIALLLALDKVNADESSFLRRTASLQRRVISAIASTKC